MGEVISYTKVGIDAFLKEASLDVDGNLVLTRGNGQIINLSLAGITQEELDQAIAGLVDASPDLLNTLNELAAALADDPNFATTVANNLSTAKAGSMGIAIHGADPNFPRPAGYGVIHWFGTVEPVNAVDNDLWTNA